MLSNELLDVAPFLDRYLSGVENAASHILKNFHLLQNSDSSQILFREAAMIFLFSANITEGILSGFNEAAIAGMIRDAVKMIIDMKIFGNEPMVYEILEKFLASNDSSLIAQKVTEMLAWLGSTQASGLDLLTQALPKINDILRPVWGLLTQISRDMSAFMELIEDLGGNIIAMLRQLVSTGGLLPPMEQHGNMFQQQMGRSFHNSTRSRHKREALLLSPRDPMDDFIDLFYIDYPTMFRAIAVPPTTAEIMETAHVFVTNPNLNVVLKGTTRGLPWGLNTSREGTIDGVLGVLSFLTSPGTFHT